jgi:hypothetical protein
MPDYKEMCLTLFRSITKAITILQEAQQQTEETYISEQQPDLRVLDIHSVEAAHHDEEQC